MVRVTARSSAWDCSVSLTTELVMFEGGREDGRGETEGKYNGAGIRVIKGT